MAHQRQHLLAMPLLAWSAAIGLAACATATDTHPLDRGRTPSDAGAAGSGGSAGTASGTGGVSSGGTGGSATGGTPSGGSAGMETGGTSSGGSAGTVTGGTSSGGTSSGGTGGTATGGTSSGGSGGISTGGTGGSPSGGASGTGGTVGSDACGGPFTDTHATRMRRISAGVPAYATPGFTYDGRTPGDANDNDVATRWRSFDRNDPANPNHDLEYISSAKPVWLAYDLSSVPAAQRQRVLVLWDNASANYDHALFGGMGDSYNLPMDYALEANPAPGGTVPSSGWTPRLSFTGNTAHSRQHVINLADATWVRLFVTKADGTAYNWDVEVNQHLYDASAGCGDSWFCIGDGVGGDAFRPDTGQTIAQRISGATSPAYDPAMDGGSVGDRAAGDLLKTDAAYGGEVVFDHWMRTFPGKYVCISFGTFSVTGNPSQAQIAAAYGDLVTLAERVKAAGKFPCIPLVPWAPDASVQQNAPILNDMIRNGLFQDASVIHGPDLYAALQGKTGDFQDNVHLNAVGQGDVRQAWADALVPAVYQ